MAATIEVKYFNSFWLKRLETISKVSSLGNGGLLSPIYTSSPISGGNTINVNDTVTRVFVGQVLSYTITGVTYSYLITNISYAAPTTTFTLNNTVQSSASSVQLSFKGIVPNTMSLQTESLLNTNTLNLRATTYNTGIGQTVTYIVGGITYTNTIKYINGLVITLNNNIPTTIPVDTLITFGTITNLAVIPSKYEQTVLTDWSIEESRINGGYNNTSVDFGVRAYIVEDSLSRVVLPSSLIYSGVYNSRTGINNINQFPVGEDITKSVTPSEGSIQKLYAENTNLIIFQEKKVSKALIDKDAVYTAEGSPMSTTSNVVIGQVQAYAGNYGIGTNPESFATYGYRKYFTDATQNVVLRLSQDGITEISDYGMVNYFRNSFSTVGVKEGFIVGMYDTHSGQYVLSVQGNRSGNVVPYTLAFDEDNIGWVSTFSYIPDTGVSLNNDFYTFKNGYVYKHYSKTTGKANFYGIPNKSTVTFIFNPSVSTSKCFLTVNYEGTSNWNMTLFYTDSDNSVPINSYLLPVNSNELQNQLFSNNFKRKENKYFGNILNITNVIQGGEILYGQSMSGVKGFFSTVTFSTDNSTIVSSNTSSAELYAVSSEYIESSY